MGKGEFHLHPDPCNNAIAIKEAIEFDGKQDLRTKVMIALFGLFAEVERDLISERTKEGLQLLPATRPRVKSPHSFGSSERVLQSRDDLIVHLQLWPVQPLKYRSENLKSEAHLRGTVASFMSPFGPH